MSDKKTLTVWEVRLGNDVVFTVEATTLQSGAWNVNERDRIARFYTAEGVLLAAIADYKSVRCLGEPIRPSCPDPESPPTACIRHWRARLTPESAGCLLGLEHGYSAHNPRLERLVGEIVCRLDAYERELNGEGDKDG